MTPSPRLLDQLPPDAMLTVPISWVRDLLAQVASGTEEPLADLNAEQVGAALGRCPSTIRSWCAGGRLDAYKLNSREWRVTREALRAYQDAQRQSKVDNGKGFRPGRDVDLRAWRKVRRKGT